MESQSLKGIVYFLDISEAAKKSILSKESSVGKTALFLVTFLNCLCKASTWLVV